MFIPKRIIFEKGSLAYEIGKNIYYTFKFKDNGRRKNTYGNDIFSLHWINN